MKDVDDGTKIAKFYYTEANRLKFFETSAESVDVEAEQIWSPKFPMIPAKVALKIAKTPTTAYELFKHLCEYDKGRDQVVKDVLIKEKLGHSRYWERGQAQKGAFWCIHSSQ